VHQPLEFRDPGPKRGAPYAPTVRIQLQALMPHTGRWLVLGSFGSRSAAASFVSRLRRNPAAIPPQGEFVFTTRSEPDGSAVVYVMALPAEAESSQSEGTT
jgi:hypothetical protein